MFSKHRILCPTVSGQILNKANFSFKDFGTETQPNLGKCKMGKFFEGVTLMNKDTFIQTCQELYAFRRMKKSFDYGIIIIHEKYSWMVASFQPKLCNLNHIRGGHLSFQATKQHSDTCEYFGNHSETYTCIFTIPQEHRWSLHVRKMFRKGQ